MIEQLTQRLFNWTNLSLQTLVQIEASIAVVLVMLVVRYGAFRLVRRQVSDVRQNYLWRRSITYSTTILGGLIIIAIWLEAFRNFGTFLGLLSAGIAIALQDLLVCFAGWMFIIARRPFTVGDRIELDGKIGDVIDIRLFQIHLLECGNWVDADQATGRTLMIPNSMVFRSQLANYTHGFQHIWEELGVLVTFESDWKKAKELLTEIANTVAQPLSEGAQEQIRRAARKQMIFFTKLTPIVYTSVKDSGVMLTIRYLTNPRQRRIAAQRVWEAILEAFAQEPKIDLAYPTLRYYQNQVEGKPETRPQ